MSLFLLYMVDVIHLIVTVLSDRPSLEWDVCTGQLIWFSSVKVNLFNMFPCCCCSVMAWTQCCLRGLGRWAGARVGDWRGGDWVVLTSHFYVSHKGSWKITASLFRLCAFYCGLFWNIYGSYISARPQLSWKKQGNFSFDNMGPLL